MSRRTVSVLTASLLCLLSAVFVSGKISSFELAANKLIEEFGEKIPEDCFLLDPVLKQKKDSATNQFRYELPNGREFEYVSKDNHTNKEVIVFTSEEDELTFKKKKRVYVVLKRSKQSHNKKHPEYFASVVYVRDAGPPDANPIDLDGGQYKVEWDLWDDHFVPGGTTKTANSVYCGASISIPCLSPDDPIKEGVNGIVKAPKHYVPKKTSEHEDKETSADHFSVSEGEADDIYDLYRDLEGERNMERRAVSGPNAVNDANPGVYGFLTPEHHAAMCTALGARGGKTCKNRRKRRSGEHSTQLDYPGWKTQYVKAVKGLYEEREENPFFGFGNCPPKPWKMSDLEHLTDPEAIMDFYLTVLRMECVSIMKGQLLSLIDQKVVDFVPANKSFVINEVIRFVKNPKFLYHEFTTVATGVGFALFTQVFLGSAKNPVQKSEAPDGRKVSKSVHLAMDIILKIMTAARAFCRIHMISGHRLHLLSWRIGFQKLAQDKQNFENSCTDCAADLELNYNDRLLSMSFLQFLKYGTHKADTTYEFINLPDMFSEFYKKNLKINELKVNMYS